MEESTFEQLNSEGKIVEVKTTQPNTESPPEEPSTDSSSVNPDSFLRTPPLEPTEDYQVVNKKYADDHFGMTNPMTLANSLIKGGTGGTPVALGPSHGTYDYMLVCRAADDKVEWAAEFRALTDLADGPGTYFGKGGKGVRVKSDASGFEFAGPGSHIEIASPAASQCAGDAAWEDWDLSGTLPAGTLYADILIVTLSTDNVGVRKNGSAVERKVAMAVAAKEFSFPMITEVDSGRVVERYSDSKANSYFYVTGYWT